MQAILMAIQHSWSLGYTKVVLESDCQKAIDILKNGKLHFGLYNWTREIKWWSQKFEEISFQWIRREANKVADKLATSRIHDTSFKTHYYVPLCISNLLHEDITLSSY